MGKSFPLATIVSVSSGCSLVNDFDEIWHCIDYLAGESTSLLQIVAIQPQLRDRLYIDLPFLKAIDQEVVKVCRLQITGDEKRAVIAILLAPFEAEYEIYPLRSGDLAMPLDEAVVESLNPDAAIVYFNTGDEE